MLQLRAAMGVARCKRAAKQLARTRGVAQGALPSTVSILTNCFLRTALNRHAQTSPAEPP